MSNYFTARITRLRGKELPREVIDHLNQHRQDAPLPPSAERATIFDTQHAMGIVEEIGRLADDLVMDFSVEDDWNLNHEVCLSRGGEWLLVAQYHDAHSPNNQCPLCGGCPCEGEKKTLSEYDLKALKYNLAKHNLRLERTTTAV